jgi:phosphonate transport system substrate-binding protein
MDRIPYIVDLRSSDAMGKVARPAFPTIHERGGKPPGEDDMRLARRTVVFGVAALSAPWVRAQGSPSFRFALTPVFLDNDAAVISALRAALASGMGQEIELVQRRTYQEISGALLDRSVDAAWTCGYPYMQHRSDFSLLGVPVWRGKSLYQSYLIVGADDPAQALEDLRGGAHAFSDPNSNSGFLVTASDLARSGDTPDGFFSRTIFTYGHRNVVRAVAGGLTRSGSVDGYVWEALSVAEPELTARTKVISRSEWLGFPPFVARRDRAGEPSVTACRGALLGLSGTIEGKAALRLLFLDAVVPGDDALFEGIAVRVAALEGG